MSVYQRERVCLVYVSLSVYVQACVCSFVYVSVCMCPFVCVCVFVLIPASKLSWQPNQSGSRQLGLRFFIGLNDGGS